MPVPDDSQVTHNPQQAMLLHNTLTLKAGLKNKQQDYDPCIGVMRVSCLLNDNWT
jgi:hypothetical protein